MTENPTSRLKVTFLMIVLFLLAVFLGGAVVWLKDGYILITFGVLTAAFLLLSAIRGESLPFYVLVGSLCIDHVLRSEILPTTYLIFPGLILASSFALSLLSRRARLVLDKKTFLPGLFVCMWATLSAVSLGRGSTPRPYWLVFVLFTLAQNLLQEKNRFSGAAWMLVLSLTAVGAWVSFERVQLYLQTGGSLSAAQLHSALLEVGDKNTVGMQLTLAIPFAVYLWYEHPAGLARAAAGICLTLLSLGTICMVSIGAALGLICAFSLSALLLGKKGQRGRLFLTGAVLLSLTALSPFGSRLLERFDAQRASFLMGDPATWGTDRGMMWTAASKTIANSPWLGEGPGNIENITRAAMPYIPYDDLRYLLQRAKPIVPHNLFLSAAVETGLVGLAGFILLILACLLPLTKAAFRTFEPSTPPETGAVGKPIFISLVVLLFQGQGLGVHLNKYLWLLLGMAAAYTNLRLDGEGPFPQTDLNPSRELLEESDLHAGVYPHP